MFVECVLVPNPGYRIYFHVSFEIVTVCQLQAHYLVILGAIQQGRFLEEKTLKRSEGLNGVQWSLAQLVSREPGLNPS